MSVDLSHYMRLYVCCSVCLPVFIFVSLLISLCASYLSGCLHVYCLSVCLSVCLSNRTYFSQYNTEFAGKDLNVLPVWANNVTGSGVVVAILDDGQCSHRSSIFYIVFRHGNYFYKNIFSLSYFSTKTFSDSDIVT